MPFWNKKVCGVLSHPTGLTKGVQKGLTIMTSKTIMCALKEKSSPLKKCFIEEKQHKEKGI
jgi:hypothetical protein